MMKQVKQLLHGLGTVVICGDFSSRCGCLKDVDGDMIP